MDALNGLVKQGKVRTLGASVMFGYLFNNMQFVAKEKYLTPFSVIENHYNLLYREEEEREIISIMNISLILYSPLAACHLARNTIVRCHR